MSDKLKIMQTQIADNAHTEETDLFSVSIGYPDLTAPSKCTEVHQPECKQPELDESALCDHVSKAKYLALAASFPV